jgi:hypothetical protein
VLALLPERGVGLFVAYNAGTARPLTVGGETLAAFVDHFFPSPAAAPAVPPPDFTARADQYTGEYRRNNFGGSYTTVEKLGRLLNGQTNRRVTNPGDGTLELASGLFGSSRFVEVEPDLFRQVDGQELLLFRRDEHGRVAKAFLSGEPEYAFERLTPTETTTFNLVLLGPCLALFGSALLAPLGAWALARRHKHRAATTGLAGVARWVALGAAALSLAFLVGLAAVLGDPALLMGDYAKLRALLVLPLVVTGLVVGSAGFAILAWARRLWSLPARLHYSAVALAGAGFIWFLWNWNLLGFRL